MAVHKCEQEIQAIKSELEQVRMGGAGVGVCNGIASAVMWTRASAPFTWSCSMCWARTLAHVFGSWIALHCSGNALLRSPNPYPPLTPTPPHILACQVEEKLRTALEQSGAVQDEMREAVLQLKGVEREIKGLAQRQKALVAQQKVCGVVWCGVDVGVDLVYGGVWICCVGVAVVCTVILGGRGGQQLVIVVANRRCGWFPMVGGACDSQCPCALQLLCCVRSSRA